MYVPCPWYENRPGGNFLGVQASVNNKYDIFYFKRQATRSLYRPALYRGEEPQVRQRESSIGRGSLKLRAVRNLCGRMVLLVIM